MAFELCSACYSHFPEQFRKSGNFFTAFHPGTINLLCYSFCNNSSGLSRQLQAASQTNKNTLLVLIDGLWQLTQCHLFYWNARQLCARISSLPLLHFSSKIKYFQGRSTLNQLEALHVVFIAFYQAVSFDPLLGGLGTFLRGHIIFYH